MEQLWLSRSKPNGRTQARSELHHPDTIDSSTKSIRVPLPKDGVLAFFGHICSPTHTCDLNSVDSGTTL
ncbi:hypothetical protein JG688_00015233 [Phytophthora aleatoria]|uniref:Uncharacterized protein n=1 Tax=Phytophthora aleatoria TaxID=2496075 RepID=A0A8J5LX02_9STRA|nr:hypothetical protein JG688_00015233 [Phytophthora aleatoria]